MMKVLPAIDLKGGQCVRLQKGDYGTAQKVAPAARKPFAAKQRRAFSQRARG